MNKELTYILGAGSSYQSIPVVRTFNRRLKNFEAFLKKSGDNLFGNERANYHEASIAISELEKEFSSHHSFDTYFKKLFHLKQTSKINNGKRLLNLYFLWEHSVLSMIDYENNVESKDIFKKQNQFDKRYDALIAGLLRPNSEKSQSICKVNFITWNYDINLLQSIKNFFFPELSYSDLFKKITKSQFVWEIDDRIKIINVNGFFYSCKLDNLLSLAGFSAHSYIQENIFEDYHNKTNNDRDSDTIRFSWELLSDDFQSLTTYLDSTVRSSDNIIIIGYTFPLYNRFLDLKYIQQSSFYNKRIFIQDPNADDLKQNLIDYYRIEILKDNIFPIKNCDSFYVPSDIFGIEEYCLPLSTIY